MRPFEGEHDGSSVTICACAGFKPVLGSGRASFENRPEFVRGEAACGKSPRGEKADVNVRAAEILDTHGNAILR